MRIETGHKFLRLVNPIQITRGPPSTENQCRLGQWYTERNPPTIHYNQCQQLGSTSQYYRQHQFLRLVLFSSTGSSGYKSQSNTIVINIRPNQALAWNSKCQFQLQWFTWPDPVVLLFKGSMQKTHANKTWLLCRYSYRSNLQLLRRPNTRGKKFWHFKLPVWLVKGMKLFDFESK